jgi:hypothetical protein
MSTYLEELLLKYMNPERQSFQEFIFRDQIGLYKYIKNPDGSFTKNYLKENILPENYLEETCKMLEVNSKNLTLCHQYLFNAILNLDNKNAKDILKEILTIITSEKDFFDIVKDNIQQIDHNIIVSLLKNLNFTNINDTQIKKIENVGDWYIKNFRSDIKNPTKISNNFKLFLDYLQLLVDYINDNPAILNPNYTDYNSYLDNITKLENQFNSIYNKNAIYKDILLNEKNLDVKTSEFNKNFTNELLNMLNIFEESHVEVQNFLELIKNTYNKSSKKLIIDNIEINDAKIINLLFINLSIYLDNYTKIHNKIIILINYIIINPKYDIIDDLDNPKKIKKELSIDEIEDEINKFQNIRNNLRLLQDKMKEIYPNNNIY